MKQRSWILAVAFVGLIVSGCDSGGDAKGGDAKGDAKADASGDEKDDGGDESKADEKSGDDAVPEAAAGGPGSWKALGKAGGWKATKVAAVSGGDLYTVEKGSGALWKTDLGSGSWTTVGKPDFANTVYLLDGGSALYSIETNGSLFEINPGDGTWKGLGQPGGWKATKAAAIRGGDLFTVETTSGALWKTDLSSGKWVTVGKPDFAGTKFLFNGPDALYSIETSGNLYRINPDDGSWKQVGPAGGWKATKVAAVRGDSLYSVEQGSGALWKTDLSSGKWVTVGKPAFSNTNFLVNAGASLYSIESSGNLYVIVP